MFALRPTIGDWAVPPPGNDGIGMGASPAKVNLAGEALLSTRAAYYGLINHVDDQIHRLLNNVTGVPAMAADRVCVRVPVPHGRSREIRLVHPRRPRAVF